MPEGTIANMSGVKTAIKTNKWTGKDGAGDNEIIKPTHDLPKAEGHLPKGKSP